MIRLSILPWMTLLLFVRAFCCPAMAQAPGSRVIKTFPYSQNFSFITGATTALPTGDADGAEFKPDSTRVPPSPPTLPTPPVFVTSIAQAGLHNAGGGALRIQTTNTAYAQGIVFYADMTGYCSGTLSIDWARLANPSSVNDSSRTSELRVATNNGNGTTFSDLPGITWPQFINRSAPPQNGTFTVSLPPSLGNRRDVRIRIYCINTGGSGNHPRVIVDNLQITANGLPPSVATSAYALGTGLHNMTLHCSLGPNSDSLLIIRRTGAPPAAGPVNGAYYSAGQGLSATDTVVGKLPGSSVWLYQNGLQDNTTYYFAIYGYRSCTGTYSAANTFSASTLGTCAGVPGNVDSLQVTGRSPTTLSLGFLPPDRADLILIVRRLGNVPPNLVPAEDSVYAAGASVGPDEVVEYFGPPVSPVISRGLNPNISYTFAVYGYQECNRKFSQYGSVTTGATYCSGEVAPVDSILPVFQTQTSIGFRIAGANGATRYLVLRDGPNGIVPVPAGGRDYTVGQTIDDDVVVYFGASPLAIATGLSPATQSAPSFHQFTAYGYRDCSRTWSPVSAGGTIVLGTLRPCSPGDAQPPPPDSLRPVALMTDSVRLRWKPSTLLTNPLSPPFGYRYVVVARADSTPAVRPANGAILLPGDSIPQGREVVLARTNSLADTVVTVMLPQNTAYFARVYTVRDCDLLYSAASGVNTPFATAGTPYRRRFPVPSGRMPAPVTFGELTLRFTQIPAADGSMLITRETGTPGYNGLPVYRNRRPDLNALSPDGWWRIGGKGLGDVRYDLRWDLKDQPLISEVPDLDILYRIDSAFAWEYGVTSGYVTGASPQIYADGRTWFGDYVLGGNRNMNFLPVSLISFQAFAGSGRNILRWKTASESGNTGFRLSRAMEPKPGFALLADHGSDPALEGAGNSSSERSYTFLDTVNIRPGEIYTYKLEEVGIDGTVQETGRVRIQAYDGRTPDRATLTIVPNPTRGRPAVIINYSLSEPGRVTIRLYDGTGGISRTIIDAQPEEPGAHSLVLPTEDLPAGSYYCRMTSGGGTVVRKVTVTR